MFLSRNVVSGFLPTAAGLRPGDIVLTATPDGTIERHHILTVDATIPDQITVTALTDMGTTVTVTLAVNAEVDLEPPF